ncbi:hypothetical protein EVA_17575 [gut metagenome]|uniref:Uncharacterized protein n=1 Tax=gut metagenome TaxID=749906 RepID=J9C3B6_9ZZZZ
MHEFKMCLINLDLKKYKHQHWNITRPTTKHLRLYKIAR